MIACIRIPHFALRIALLDQPELDGLPLVLGPSPGGRPLVADAVPEAAARGIRPGIGLREATALCPEAVIITSDPLTQTAITAGLLERLEALSPLVEMDATEPGCAYVDLRGLERRLGPPARAAATLLAVAPPVLRPRGGVAPGKFAARVAAGGAPPGTAAVVRPAEVVAFLAGQPVSWLPAPPDVRQRLERLGIRTLGALAALPPAKVAARFGPLGAQLWALAAGQDGEPIRPRPRELSAVEARELPAPVTSREALLLVLDRLVHRAVARPEMRERAVRQVRVQLRLEGGGSWEKVCTPRDPAAAEQLTTLLRARLADLTLPGPVEGVVVDLIGLVPAGARQELLPGLRPRRAAPLIAAARQLKQRYGLSPIFKVVEVEPWSRIPERRHALIRFDP